MFKILNLLVIFSAFASMGASHAKEAEAILPISSAKATNLAKAKLGYDLYNDAILSKDFSRSCASCHSFSKGGADGLPVFKAPDKKVGALNTPTVFNANLNFRQFWDGRAIELGQVIDDHLQDPLIFDSNWDTLVKRIQNDTQLAAKFEKAFPSKVTPENIKQALLTYLDTLVTPDSPFDQYLKGKQDAISEDAKKGYQAFIKYGCVTCHQGPNMGGNLFQKMGIYGNYFADRKKVNPVDFGLYNKSNKEDDKFVFKVPTLRNIALTAPYLHDGSVKDLDQIVRIMGIYQSGQMIPEYDIPLIVKFLESLNGNIPSDASPAENGNGNAQTR